MMDLTKKDLPNVVWIDGRPFSIYTDFRMWMRFEVEAGKLQKGEQMDISYLFKNEMPVCCNLRDLFTFSRPASPLPRNVGGSTAILLDYELDADYIYSAFLGQYGIDLFEVEGLHWHKFLALLKGLKADEMLCRIMGYRAYERSDSRKDIYEEQKRAWEIVRISPKEQRELDKFSRLFD